MSSAEAQKVCVRCGADVAHRPRHKNADGTYLCRDCRQASKDSAKPSPPLKSGMRACVRCGAEVARGDCHKNRYGEYICSKCVEAGGRWSRRRSMQRMLHWCRVALLYLVALGAVSWIFLTVMEHYNQPASSEEEQ